jgi:hypothetical protein
MKTRAFLRVFLAMVFLCAAHSSLAKPPGISYAGGDGSSFEKAVLIKGATEETGVHAEYEYLQKHYPGYRRGGQSLQSSKGRSFDVLELTTADGKKMTIYFDITEFFGK